MTPIIVQQEQKINLQNPPEVFILGDDYENRFLKIYSTTTIKNVTKIPQ